MIGVWRRHARRGVALFVLAAVAVLAGCADEQAVKTVVTFVPNDEIGPPKAAAETIISVDDVLEVTYLKQYPMAESPYRFDVGDQLELQFYTRTEPPQTYTVQPDGRIYLPELGYLTVRGLTADEIEARIRKGYANTRLAGPVNVVARTTDAKVNEMISGLRAAAGPTRAERVLPDGTVALPLLDLVPVAGRTLAEVQADINARYASQFNDLHVSVELRDANSRRFGVMGEVTNPGIYPLVSKMSLFDALGRAGGIKDTAREYTVVVFRPSAKGVEVTKIETGKDPEAVSKLTSWQIEPSDTIYVPKSGIANFDQFILQYLRNAFPFPANLYYGGSVTTQ